MKQRNERYHEYKYLEESALLIKRCSQSKRKKKWFLGVLIATLVASLLGNTLAGKGVIPAGKDTTGAGQDF